MIEIGDREDIEGYDVRRIETFGDNKKNNL